MKANKKGRDVDGVDTRDEGNVPTMWYITSQRQDAKRRKETEYGAQVGGGEENKMRGG